ncbi:MAG: hypothetical protein SFX73_25405 [Kofleriaceae bacterium]|nr:hypothetical protein [Kofleriaceae bacterium]
MFRRWLGLDRRATRARVIAVHTARPRARASHRRTPKATAKASASDGEGEPPTRDVEVELAATPDALIALAERIGEMAANLWLDGKLTIGGAS